jgi:hypothetical protein
MGHGLAALGQGSGVAFGVVPLAVLAAEASYPYEPPGKEVAPLAEHGPAGNATGTRASSGERPMGCRSQRTKRAAKDAAPSFYCDRQKGQ